MTLGYPLNLALALRFFMGKIGGLSQNSVSPVQKNLIDKQESKSPAQKSKFLIIKYQGSRSILDSVLSLYVTGHFKR